MRLQINNEYDQLEAVLVHRPGREIERLTHDNMHEFLFEDIPFLRRMQDEHDAFVERMREHGVRPVYLADYLRELVGDPAERQTLVEEICAFEGVPALAADLHSLKIWDEYHLVDVLFAGLTFGEYRAATGRQLGNADDPDAFLLTPIPNTYFTRDPAVVVGDTVISSKMHYRQRVRETFLVRAVLEHHPQFADTRITYGGTDEPTEDRPYTIEGGDVIVLNKQAVLIGDSERTRSQTIELLAAKCFAQGNVERVYEVPIPKDRSFMHLDTVFTVLDRGMVLWFAEVMENLRYLHRYEPAPDGEGATRVTEQRTLREVLRDEFDHDVTVIQTAGGRKHYAKREQRADGTNTFMVAPKVAITYERNEYTVEAMEARGVQCVGIDDSELVRGLGGPRCMTMPLRRVAK